MAREKDLSDFERGFIVGAWMAGTSVTKTQLACVSIGTVTKMTSAFRSVEFQRLAALKLFWQHVVAQHLTKTLYVSFSFVTFSTFSFISEGE